MKFESAFFDDLKKKNVYLQFFALFYIRIST